MAVRAVVNPDWRFLSPLFDPPSDPPAKASRLTLVYCEPDVARQGIADWHSRLPYTQSGPWKFAFVAHYRFTAFAVALWNNPSARTLPNEWLELRRMAVSDDAPHCTASWFLAAMARRIRADHPDAVRRRSGTTRRPANATGRPPDPADDCTAPTRTAKLLPLPGSTGGRRRYETRRNVSRFGRTCR